MSEEEFDLQIEAELQSEEDIPPLIDAFMAQIDCHGFTELEQEIRQQLQTELKAQLDAAQEE